MNTLNYPASKKPAVYKFILLFGLSLLAVLLCAYFLFNTPANLYKSKVVTYKNMEDEQGKLLTTIGTITNILRKIIPIDSAISNGSNRIDQGTLINNAQQY